MFCWPAILLKMGGLYGPAALNVQLLPAAHAQFGAVAGVLRGAVNIIYAALTSFAPAQTSNARSPTARSATWASLLIGIGSFSAPPAQRRHVGRLVSLLA